jgi:hypothetical protein
MINIFSPSCPELVTKHEVAQYFRVGVRTVDKWLDAQLLQRVRVSSRVTRITKSSAQHLAVMSTVFSDENPKSIANLRAT